MYTTNTLSKTMGSTNLFHNFVCFYQVTKIFIKKHLCKKSSTSCLAHCRLSNPRALIQSTQHNKLLHFLPSTSFSPAWYLITNSIVGRDLQTSWEVIWLVPGLPPVSCTAVEWSDELKFITVEFCWKKEGGGGSKCIFSGLTLFSCFDSVVIVTIRRKF